MDKNTHKRGVIFNEGDVMSSFFFEVGLRVNANANVHRMDIVMMEAVAGDRHYEFQQDGALAYDANKTQAYLEEKLKDLRPKNNWFCQLGRLIAVIASYGRLWEGC